MLPPVDSTRYKLHTFFHTFSPAYSLSCNAQRLRHSGFCGKILTDNLTEALLFLAHFVGDVHQVIFHLNPLPFCWMTMTDPLVHLSPQTIVSRPKNLQNFLSNPWVSLVSMNFLWLSFNFCSHCMWDSHQMRVETLFWYIGTDANTTCIM